MIWFTLALAAPPSYTLSFEKRHQSLLSVKATLEGEGENTEVMMATWTPGSYLIREYAQHVVSLKAFDSGGSELEIHKSHKNRWVISGAGDRPFTLKYDVYSFDMEVQGNYIDDEFAMLNGAPTFIVPVGLQDEYEVQIKRPKEWKLTLSQHSEEPTDSFTAPSFDALLDAPIVVGNPTVSAFEVNGVPHFLVDIPAQAPWDSEKAVADVKKIVEEQAKLWGVIPYKHYHFFNVLTPKRGGLEHKGSTLMLARADATATEEDYKKWLGLVSHEFFHTWNVKRMRPTALGPFDYENEVFTSELWLAEGFTSYYDDLVLLRAGLITDEDWRKRMQDNIRYATRKGEAYQSLAQSSYDSWIELYRRDENSSNTTISYYNKGAVLAWVLDAKIRQATKGKRTLDEVMRLSYERYSGKKGYTADQFFATISEVAESDLGGWVKEQVNATKSIDLSSALQLYGLEHIVEKAEPTPYLGASLSGNVVRSVTWGQPASKAGLLPSDEVLAVNGRRVVGKTLLPENKVGDEIEMLVSRQGRLKTITMVVGDKPKTYTLKPMSKASKSQTKSYEQWAYEGKFAR